MKFLLLVLSVLLAESVRTDQLGSALALVPVLGSVVVQLWHSVSDLVKAEALEWAEELELARERQFRKAWALVNLEMVRVRAQAKE